MTTTTTTPPLEVLETEAAPKQIYDIHVVGIPGDRWKATAQRSGKSIAKAKTHGLLEMAMQEASRNIRKDMMDRGIVK
jgi:hypothetical protein